MSEQKANSMSVSLAKKIIRVGEKVQATANILDDAGAPIADDAREVSWSTSGFSEIASVDALGMVTALGVGVAEVTAQFGSKVGKDVLTIRS